MNLNWNDTESQPWPPQSTHAATWVAGHNFRFKPAPSAQARQSLTGMWCEHCAKDTHKDADCWSTRAVPYVT